MSRLLFLAIIKILTRLPFSCSLICALTLFIFPLSGQSIEITVDSFEVDGQLIAVDRLNQLYLLNEEDQLRKTDAKGKPQFQFSDNTLGLIEEIDVSNPFNILVFYKAFQIAKILDRTLNPNIEFDFGSLNLFNVQSLANGVDNTVWVYDQQEGKIFQLNSTGNILNQSQDLVFITGNRPDSCQLFFRKNELWLKVDGVGLLMFNAFGQYQRTFSWKENIEKIQWWKNQLLFFSEEKWHLLNEVVWESRPILFPWNRAIDVNAFFNGDHIFWQRQNRLYILKNN